LPNHEAISAAKAGLEGFVRAAASTYASRGVRVNTVAPGLVRARVLELLTDPENSWLTGQVILVDGGMSTLRTMG
jgi:NAD(P)-dependent dehydrogenase (short-subunit alcohol dehydrogenase family)